MSSPIVQHAFPHSSFMDINLAHIGMHHCDHMHCYGPAVRNYYLFHYICSGKGDFYFTDEKGAHVKHRLETGQGFLIWPGIQHTYIADEIDPWSYCWVGFTGIKAEGLLAQAGLDRNQPIYAPKPMSPSASQVKDTILHIFNHADAPICELIGYVYLFLSALEKSCIYSKKIAKNGIWEFYAQEILGFIEENYHRDISMRDISSLCSLDKNHLGKIFKTVMGVNFRDFLIQFRMNKACELMRVTHHSIGEISTLVGYANMFNFSRVFKSILGVSPRKWREINQLQ